MSYLAALKELDTPSGLPTKPTEPGMVGFVGCLPGGMLEFKAENQASGPQPIKACIWRIKYADRPPKVVVCSPPLTEAEILVGETGGLFAEVAQGCKSCRHALRPGQALYCGCEERQDLEAVYSSNHLAKRLPSDQRAACEQYRGIENG